MTAPRWKSDGPATVSRRPSVNGSASETAGAPSPAAATTPWTTKQTTFWPGPTAAPRASPTWASPAPNITASNTAPPGNQPGPARTIHRGGLHRRDATTPANTRIGNHPSGRTTCWPRTHSWTRIRAEITTWNSAPIPSRTGTNSRPLIHCRPHAQPSWWHDSDWIRRLEPLNRSRPWPSRTAVHRGGMGL